MRTALAVHVLILAGGLGTRLRSVVADRPKVLAEVAGKPFITHLLYLKNGTIYNQGAKEDMLTDAVLSGDLDCPITLKKNEGRYWITGSRPSAPDQPS